MTTLLHHIILPLFTPVSIQNLFHTLNQCTNNSFYNSKKYLFFVLAAVHCYFGKLSQCYTGKLYLPAVLICRFVLVKTNFSGKYFRDNIFTSAILGKINRHNISLQE